MKFWQDYPGQAPKQAWNEFWPSWLAGMTGYLALGFSVDFLFRMHWLSIVCAIIGYVLFAQIFRAWRKKRHDKKVQQTQDLHE